MALKKKFNEIELPLFNEVSFLLGEKEDLVKKTIKLDVSKKLKGKSAEIVFFIRELEGKFIGIPKRITVFKNYIVRLIRNKTSYVEDSFEVQCKDVVAKIKPFLVTRKKVSRALRKALREKIKELIIEKFKEMTFYEIIEAIIREDIQKEIAKKIKKIYPPLAFEIREIETKEKEKVIFENKNKGE
ncbi:MAG: hypothetical protein QXX68_00410 [Candidatus Pacearchaeota archaeon]